MGARWPWCAVCENGHISSNFSGGSDGYCYKCNADIIAEHQCEWDGCQGTEDLMRAYREFDNNRRQLSLPI